MPDLALPNLRACLEAASWRRLLAMMATHGLPCSTRWRKADLVSALHEHLAAPATWRQPIAELHGPARTALSALLQAAGALPATAFTATFGPVRPHRPWRDDAPAIPPWQAPASPAERLWYLGLLHLDPPAAGPGVVQRIITPAELLPILQPLLRTTEADQPLHLLPRPGRPADLAWHVALLLASVEAAPQAPIRGRWLPPNLLAALANRVGLDLAADYTPARSEHRLPYLAFLHGLAEAAGLLAGTARLTITAAGWQWLAAPAAERLAALWRAWLAAPVALTRDYRFPWANLSLTGRNLALDQFRAAALGQFRPLHDIVQAAHLHDPHGHLAQPWRVSEDVAAALITGPLFWFGVIDLAQPPEADPPAALPDLAKAQVKAEKVEAEMDSPLAPPAPADLNLNLDVIPHRLVRLTLTGAWLLGLPDCAAPALPAPVACTASANDPDQLYIPAGALPLHLARLAPLAEWQPPALPTMAQPLRLTAPAVGQAAAAGLPLAQMLDYLAQALDRPPSRRQTQRLRQWTAAGQQVRIRHLTVLETAGAALLGQLRGRKLIRRHLGDPLSPTRVVLNPAAIPAVVQHLATLGLYANCAAASSQLVEPHPGDRPDGLVGAIPGGRPDEQVDAGAIPGGRPGEQVGVGVTPGGRPGEQVGVGATPGGRPGEQVGVGATPGGRPGEQVGVGATPGGRPGEFDHASGGLLYMAGLVYRGLAEHIALPAPLSAAVLDDLAAQLDTQQQAAAHFLAQQTLEALAATLAGYLGLPAWQAHESENDPWAQIEHALAHKQDLRLTYWGAGREQAVVRRVTPYWIERRNAVPYLVGYCHLREAERTFRIDRITECQLLPPTAAGD